MVQLGFDWVILEDRYGSYLAVRALSETTNIHIALLDFVAECLESNEGACGY